MKNEFESKANEGDKHLNLKRLHLCLVPDTSFHIFSFLSQHQMSSNNAQVSPERKRYLTFSKFFLPLETEKLSNFYYRLENLHKSLSFQFNFLFLEPRNEHHFVPKTHNLSIQLPLWKSVANISICLSFTFQNRERFPSALPKPPNSPKYFRSMISPITSFVLKKNE